MEIKTELIIRRNLPLFAFFALTFTALTLWILFGPYEKTRIIFERNFYLAIVLSIVLGAVTLYSWIRLLDNRPVIIFSENGIWTKKLGSINWYEITAFYSKTVKAEYFDSSSIAFRISGQDKVVTISTTFLNANINKIIDFIKVNSPSTVIGNL